MHLKFISGPLHTFPYIISGMKALSASRAEMFYCLGGTPPSCRAEPASPWHPVRAFGQMASSTAIALYSSSDL